MLTILPSCSGALVLMLLVSCVSPVLKKNNSELRESLAKIRATVVIDPGHGGLDSGAVSASGLREKDLCLDIALKIRHLLRIIMPEVKVVMTRTSDKSVSLLERIRIANEAQGDLFISVHINSSDNKDAKGFEVYSLDVTHDRYAQRLAARENSGVDFILADLRANGHRHESDQLARFIATSLNTQVSKNIGVQAAHDRGFNQALFQVLFGVQMPAVLTELFFISNPHDENLLRTNHMREYCARGIVAGIGNYLKSNDQRIVRATHAVK